MVETARSATPATAYSACLASLDSMVAISIVLLSSVGHRACGPLPRLPGRGGAVWGCRCGALRPAPLSAGQERPVDVDQHLLLPLGEVGIAQDRRNQVALALVLVEDAGPQVQRLGADPQRLGDVLEDLGGGLPESPLDLRQVRIGHPRLARQVAEGQLGQPPLLA